MLFSTSPAPKYVHDLLQIKWQGSSRDNRNFFWSLLVRPPPPILHYCRCARTRPVVQCKEFYVPLLQLYGVFYNTECTGLLLRWNVQHSTCAVPLPPPPPTSKSACPTPLVSQPPEDRGPSLVKQSRQISYPGHPSHPGHPFGPCPPPRDCKPTSGERGLQVTGPNPVKQSKQRDILMKPTILVDIQYPFRI